MCESYAWQTIHMKGLKTCFLWKIKKKKKIKNECHLLQILLGALRINKLRSVNIGGINDNLGSRVSSAFFFELGLVFLERSFNTNI